MPVSPSGAPARTPRASSSQTRSVGTPRTDAASVTEYPFIIRPLRVARRSSEPAPSDRQAVAIIGRRDDHLAGRADRRRPRLQSAAGAGGARRPGLQPVVDLEPPGPGALHPDQPERVGAPP